MKRVIAVALLLSSCAPSIVSSNSVGGTIGMNGMVSGQSKAMEMANAECAKHGKVAQSQGVNDIRNTLRYECVKP